MPCVTITNSIPVVFKHLKHLAYAVRSILEQTLLPNEIIIIISEYVKNAGNDKILEEIERDIDKLNIKSIFKTFSGRQYAGKNREIAYNLCATDLIIYQDCDDWAHKQRNEIFRQTFERTKSPHILHGWTADQDSKNRHIDNDTIQTDKYRNRMRFQRRGHHVANGTFLINKAVIGPLRFPNMRIGEDVNLNRFLSRRFNSLVILNNNMYIYNEDLSSHNAE